MEYRQIKTSVYEEREKENMRATIAEQAAIIDYIALMTDVELPTQDTGMEESEVQQYDNTETTETDGTHGTQQKL